MASTTISMLVLLSRKDNPNLRLIKDYILGIPIELGITDELGAEVFQIAKDQFDAVGRSINELLMDNTISSESAVRKQKELAERYKVLANWLENIKVNNIGTWSSIIDELDRLPEGATLESKIEFLEFKFSSNYPKTT